MNSQAFESGVTHRAYVRKHEIYLLDKIMFFVL